MMNELPDELVISIFEYLKIRDLIQCSLVCKRFKLLCQFVKVAELLINNSTKNTNGCWFYTNRKFNLQDAIDVTTFDSYRSIFRPDKFRRLYFGGSLSEYNKLKISDFTHIEQVTIYVKLGVSVGVEHKIYIDLPNVKIVRFRTDSEQADHKLFVTTPKLERLKCEDFDVIQLTHPKAIIHLETTKYCESFHVLKNLQFLQIAKVYRFNASDTLSAFPKLKTIAFNSFLGRIPESVKDMFNYKRVHRRTEPKIYFLSVELNDSKKIHEYDCNRDPLQFQICNYSSLLETVFIPSDHMGIMYDQLIDMTKGNIAGDFFKKYFSVRSVSIGRKVENQEHLFKFLKKFNYLSTLELLGDSLDQCYLNRLDELDQLSSLSVGRNPKSIFNFDFLLRLKNLTSFHTDFESSAFFDLTLDLFKRLKYFQSMFFCFGGKAVNISKMRTSDKYSISYMPYLTAQLDINGLAIEMNAIKSGQIHKDRETPTADEWLKAKWESFGK